VQTTRRDTPRHGSDGTLPEEDKDVTRMQGHWLLARMGKRVLRPGGLELTHRLLERLDIGTTDNDETGIPAL